jgi:hypothetical protein
VNCTIQAATTNRARRSAMKFAALATCLLCGMPAVAEPSSCERALGTTDIILIRSVLHLRGVAQAPEDQQCAAYRQHVITVSKVREVFDRCLSGVKRDVDLEQLEGALDDANHVIARVCDATRQTAQPAPPNLADVP